MNFTSSHGLYHSGRVEVGQILKLFGTAWPLWSKPVVVTNGLYRLYWIWRHRSHICPTTWRLCACLCMCRCRRNQTGIAACFIDVRIKTRIWFDLQDGDFHSKKGLFNTVYWGQAYMYLIVDTWRYSLPKLSYNTSFQIGIWTHLRILWLTWTGAVKCYTNVITNAVLLLLLLWNLTGW